MRRPWSRLASLRAIGSVQVEDFQRLLFGARSATLARDEAAPWRDPFPRAAREALVRRAKGRERVAY